jgi:hypothetical protein
LRSHSASLLPGQDLPFANGGFWGKRRDEIDVMLDGLIQPGNLIELFDGMQTKEAFESAIAPGFTGFLDLTTCTSTILGDHVSRQRGAALRLLAFATNQDLMWHSNCMATALEMTVHDRRPYPDARIEAERLFRQAIDDHSCMRGFRDSDLLVSILSEASEAHVKMLMDRLIKALSASARQTSAGAVSR